MSSRLGVSDDKILALDDYGSSALFTDDEKIALEYADAITLSDRDVDDDLFDRLQEVYDDEAVIEQVQPRIANRVAGTLAALIRAERLRTMTC